MACADCDTPLNLLDCLVDYLDGVDPMTAFVVRGLHEFVARLIQGIERPFHVTLVGMGTLDQRNSGDDESEDLAEKSGFHESFRAFRGRMLWKFAQGQGNLFTRASPAGSSKIRETGFRCRSPDKLSGLILEEGEPILGSLLLYTLAVQGLKLSDKLIRYEIADTVIAKPAIRWRRRFSAECSTEPN